VVPIDSHPNTTPTSNGDIRDAVQTLVAGDSPMISLSSAQQLR
jgi:hypothetical protein